MATDEEFYVVDWLELRSLYLWRGPKILNYGYPLLFALRNWNRSELSSYHPRFSGFGKIPSYYICNDFLTPRWNDPVAMNYDEHILFRWFRMFSPWMQKEYALPLGDLLCEGCVVISPRRVAQMAYYLKVLDFGEAFDCLDYWHYDSDWEKSAMFSQELASFWIEAARRNKAIVYGIF